MNRPQRVTWDDERLSVFKDLTNHQLRNALDPTRGIMIAESEIAVRRCLELGAYPLTIALDERRLKTMEDVVKTLPLDTELLLIDSADAERLIGYKLTRGILAALRRPAPQSVSEIVSGAQRILVMEGIVDTTNVGALFRSAAALGVDGILISPDSCDPLTRRAVRTSMGNVLAVPWSRCGEPWPEKAYDELRAADFHIVALALCDRATPLDDASLLEHEKLAIVVGTEGTGLSDAAVTMADESVVIPMVGEVDSLNVGVAAGIALWELRRRI